MRPSLPLVYSGIKLMNHISTELLYKTLHLQLWPPVQPLQLVPHNKLASCSHPQFLGSVVYTDKQMN